LGLKVAKVVKVNPSEPEEEAVALATEVIKTGGLVALPTETVYGLAADFKNESAVRRVFFVKRRPLNLGLIVGVRSILDIYSLAAEVPPQALRLFRLFSPGPLTGVFKRKDFLLPILSGNTDGIAIRIPRSKIAIRIMEKSGTFVTLTSANRHQRRSPQTAEEVERDIGEEIDLILDGGKTEIGKESTIIDFTQIPPKILREGAIPWREIKRYLRVD